MPIYIIGGRQWLIGQPEKKRLKGTGENVAESTPQVIDSFYQIDSDILAQCCMGQWCPSVPWHMIVMHLNNNDMIWYDIAYTVSHASRVKGSSSLCKGSVGRQNDVHSWPCTWIQSLTHSNWAKVKKKKKLVGAPRACSGLLPTELRAPETCSRGNVVGDSRPHYLELRCQCPCNSERTTKGVLHRTWRGEVAHM